jgi:hypothetical protein
MMQAEVIEIIEPELKYCERCGGLWLRQEGAEEVYCPGCALKMAELPIGRRKRGCPKTVEQNRDMKTECDELYRVCGEGGNA